jgi:hypothetical protein
LLILSKTFSFAIWLVTRRWLAQSWETSPKMKKKLQLSLALAAVAGLGLFSNPAFAQDDAARAERRQGQLDRYRERIEVKSDEDWKKIEPLVGKVMDAQAASFGGFGGFGGRGGQGGGGGNRGGRGQTQTMPEQEALTKALEDKAPADEIKAKLAKYREARKTRDAEREAKLEKAQDELRKALTPRQEAGAVLARLLK